MLLFWALALFPVALAEQVHIESYASDLFNVTDRYIVTLSAHANEVKHVELVGALVSSANVAHLTPFRGITRRFRLGAFRGYAGHFSGVTVASLRKQKDIANIEPDRIWYSVALNATAPVEEGEIESFHTPSSCPIDPELPCLMRQRPATWGLHHVSHRGYSDRSTYWFDRSAGSATWGYVVDSGIRATHAEFQPEGRVKLAYNAVKPVPFEDRDGHGTHVASTMCGKYYGVAKKCNLVAIKVIHDELGTLAAVIDGYAWAAEDIIFQKRTGKAVINMSIGGPISRALNYAVTEAYKLGVTTVVAAGNGRTDARMGSPASAPGVIAVGSTDAYRQRARESNFGPAVSIFAPGVRVLGASVQGDRKAIFASGTSMASPHVAGLALYYKARGRGPDAKATKRVLQKTAIAGVVRDARSSSNLYAYNDSGR